MDFNRVYAIFLVFSSFSSFASSQISQYISQTEVKNSIQKVKVMQFGQINLKTFLEPQKANCLVFCLPSMNRSVTNGLKRAMSLKTPAEVCNL